MLFVVQINNFLSVCLKMWLRLFLKILFVPKCIKVMFFYFLKIIFEISESKQCKTYKKIFFSKKKN